MNYTASVEIVAFLNQYRAEGCTVIAAVNALHRDDAANFEWLVDNYADMMKPDAIRKMLENGGGAFTPSLLTDEEPNEAKSQRTY